MGVRASVTSNKKRIAFLQRIACCKDRAFKRCAKSQRACDDKQAQETEQHGSGHFLKTSSSVCCDK